MSTRVPDYYRELGIDPKATQAQIRTAYKKQALAHHPDRVDPNDKRGREQATKKFQLINDAYYTLSDPTRRRDYDSARAFHSFTPPQADNSYQSPQDAPQGDHKNWYENFFSFFNTPDADRARNDQWNDVFEEMMREEGMAEGENAQPTGRFWSYVGGLSGGAMGFIIANFPGAVAGFVAGGKLGQIRDTKGESVATVFAKLPQGEKAKLLADLATKIFAHAVSG